MPVIRPAVSAFACFLSIGAATLRAVDAGGAQVLDAIQHQVLDLFEKSRSAIVRIEGTDADGKLFGTGFFIDPNGMLFTSYSVGGETHDLVVSIGEARHPATRIGADARTGIAILQIDAQTPFLTFGKSRELSTASPVLAIGYPMDLPITPSFGIVGGSDLRYLGRCFATAHLRANVPVQRGEGGAPLLNLKGDVVGLLISSIDNGSASFVLPIEAAEKVRRDFARFRQVRPGWLGVEIHPASPDAADSRPVIKSLGENLPGAMAGLQVGDVLVRLGEFPLKSEDDVLSASFYLTAGDEVQLSILRGVEKLTFDLLPIDHPEFHRPSLMSPPISSDLRLQATDLEN